MTDLVVVHHNEKEKEKEKEEEQHYPNMKKKQENDDDTTTTTPNKNKNFRIYNEEGDNKSLTRVTNHYRDMRLNQTFDFYNRMERKYTFENGSYRKLMTIEQALFDELEHYVVRQ